MFKRSIVRKLRSNERLVSIINTHWLMNAMAPRLLLIVDMVLIGGLSLGLLLVPLPGESKVVLSVILAGFGIWLLAKYYKVTANRLVITDQRIINIAQKSTFRKVVDEYAYHSIQNVTYEVRGLLTTLLKLGSVRIVAFGGQIVLGRMRKPEQIQNLILDLREKASTVRVKPEVSPKGRMYDGLQNKQLLKLVGETEDVPSGDEVD